MIGNIKDDIPVDELDDEIEDDDLDDDEDVEDMDDDDNVGDISVEINVEELVAKLAATDSDDGGRKREIRRRLGERTDHRAFTHVRKAHVDVSNRADVPIAHQFATEEHPFVVPLLRSVLENDPVAFDGIDHRPAFRDGSGKRLLTIDVLASFGGSDGHQGVPVVGRGDVDRVDVISCKDLAEVDERAAGGVLLAAP